MSSYYPINLTPVADKFLAKRMSDIINIFVYRKDLKRIMNHDVSCGNEDVIFDRFNYNE